MANVQDKLHCITCGGTFFRVVRAEQFLAGGYGTAEFRSMSSAPKTVLLCIGCGSPVSPKPAYYGQGTVADLAEQDFRKSMELGQKYRKDNSIQNVATVAASLNELNEVRQMVEDVRKGVESLLKPKPKVPKPRTALVASH